MDTNIWVIPIPIHGYLYILLPILKFHTDTDTKDTDTKRIRSIWNSIKLLQMHNETMLSNYILQVKIHKHFYV